MPPTHAKMPTAMKTMCAHGGPVKCKVGCYAEGGTVGFGKDKMLLGRKGGTHEEMSQDVNPGFGMDHELLGRKGGMFKEHHKKEGSDIGMDRELLAHGGEVEEMEEHEGDEHELGKVLAGELMTAMEHKDHKGVMEAIEAIVMNCMSKGGM